MVPLFSPGRQNEVFLEKIQEGFADLIRTGHYILGAQVSKFEHKLENELGYQHAVACSSGTDALTLSIKALDLPPGSHIITPAFSFFASSASIVWAGHTPVFADVDKLTGNVTEQTVSEVLTDKTRAIMAVDLYGRQAPIKELLQICEAKGLYLVEDGAQSIGVENKGADIYTTSFYPTKNMGCLGDAGAILTDDPKLEENLRMYTQQGQRQRDHHEVLGTNGRMDTLQAIVLNEKLPYLKQWTAKRTEIAAKYQEGLLPLEKRGCFQLPPASEESVWSLYTLIVPKARETLIEKLKERQIGCGIYYSKPLNLQPALKEFYRPCPKAEALAEQVLSLPLFPELTEREVELVIQAVNESF